MKRFEKQTKIGKIIPWVRTLLSCLNSTTFHDCFHEIFHDHRFSFHVWKFDPYEPSIQLQCTVFVYLSYCFSLLFTLVHFILTIERLNRVSISPSSHSKASEDRWNSSAIRLEHRVERRRMLNNSVALNWACLLMASSPCTTINFLDSSRMPRKKNNHK